MHTLGLIPKKGKWGQSYKLQNFFRDYFAKVEREEWVRGSDLEM